MKRKDKSNLSSALYAIKFRQDTNRILDQEHRMKETLEQIRLQSSRFFDATSGY